MKSDDTIVAISSAVGAATRMIVRASGPLVRAIFERLTGSDACTPSSAGLLPIEFSGVRLRAWVYTFEAPHSATGEDVVECHIPGNPLLARMLLEAIVRIGARQAEAGEFSARSYFNGKIDLTEAEGVAAAIAAQSERELRAARQLMAGELAQRLKPVLDALADTLALIEAGIDFTDQGISFISSEQLRDRVEFAEESLSALLRTSSRLEKLSHEPTVVLAGRPNAGKSTLLNTLAGRERAIVSPIAGTTRDILWAHVHLRRGIVRLIDAAGLEAISPGGSIAAAMQSQARRAIEEADCLLLIKDSTDLCPVMHLSREPDLVVHSKSDLCASIQPGIPAVSAKTGDGIPELIDRLDRLIFGTLSADAALALNSRHISLIEEAAQSLDRAASLIPDGGLELLAVELREALDLLGGVLGSVTPDDVLGRVFSRFCVGK